MALNYVTLICDLGAGQGYYLTSGTAFLAPTAVLTDSTDHLIVSQVPVPVDYSDTGPPQVQLLATDNVNLLPSGWAWTITPPAGSGIAAYSFFLPHSGGATQYLSALSPVSTAVTQFPANPMTTLGDMIYENAVPTPARLPGNATAAKQFLTQTGTGTISAAPAWGPIVAGDLPASVAFLSSPNTFTVAPQVVGTAFGTGGFWLEAFSAPSDTKGCLQLGVGAGATGNVLSIINSAGTPQVWMDSTFAFNSVAGGDGVVFVSEPTNERGLAFTNAAKTLFFGFGIDTPSSSFNISCITTTTNAIAITTAGGTRILQNVGFYGGSAVSQPNTAGTTAGFTAASGTAVLSGSTFTGNTGSTAYTIGDIVNALKKLGLMAA